MKFFSHVIWNMMAILSMSIANCKEMKTLDAIEIRSKNEAILVLLVRVTWNESNCCRKSKFCYNIVPSWIFFRLLLIILIRISSLLCWLLCARPATIRRLPYLLLIVLGYKGWRLCNPCPFCTIPSVLCNWWVVVAEETLLLRDLLIKQACPHTPSSRECLQVVDRTHRLGRAHRSNLSVIC